MSIESLAIALHHSRADGTTKLVLLGIANHDGDGGAWPSVATLAKYAATTPRTVQRCIAKLEQLREVVRIVQAGGTTETPEHMRPNRYHFALQCPPDCDRTSRHRTRRQTLITELPDPLTPVSPGDTQVTPRVTVASGGGVTPTSPEPSRELPVKRTPRTSATTDRAWEESCTGSASGTHAPDPQTGWCTNACGLREPAPTGAHA